MKFGVITFPGSNCDQDMVYVLRDIMGQEVVELWHKDHDLQGSDFVVLPGGFSYGDYLRSGAIARFSPIMNEVQAHAQRGGYVMGVCNGFQILAESHLLGGALLHNDNQQFICKNVWLKAETNNSMVTRSMDLNRTYRIPIAHAEGRFHASEDSLKAILDEDRVLFSYCDENGEVNSSVNPNGSAHNIAGITNKARNVFGMMPHPERAADPHLGNEDGRVLFESILSETLAQV